MTKTITYNNYKENISVLYGAHVLNNIIYVNYYAVGCYKQFDNEFRAKMYITTSINEKYITKSFSSRKEMLECAIMNIAVNPEGLKLCEENDSTNYHYFKREILSL